MPSGIYKRTKAQKEKIRKLLLSYVLGKKGKQNNAWTDAPTYQTIHAWLRTNFGKAYHCENRRKQKLEFKCRNKNKLFVWALIPGKMYERKRESFMQLCQSCNLLCGVNDKFRKKMSKVSVKSWKHYKLINKKII